MNEPIYITIQNDIKREIENGTLQSGDLVPSENELKEKYNVSRMTARQALNNLVNDGYLYRHKGKGTFISKRKIEKNIHGVRSFTQEMAAMNRKVSSKILKFEKVASPEKVAEKLFLAKKEEVFLIERVRYGDDTPVLFEQLYIPVKLFKSITEEDLKSSFYHYVETKMNLQISHCIQSIEAIEIPKELTEYLMVKEHTPTLLIERNTFLTNGRPFEYVKSYYRGDQYKFVQHAIKG
ncbi:GntR family transcriptional regulator [Acholeplasma hippikon]|uniref:Transcriptional regulator n=1 Tax=Acholeplasma hippikon TaxID=264636 RepID=A0A449BIC4_9MOLU|nr:GntR family transcriptional regulator [Acholeplasma hippikon]VEU82188.1 transcriptional regulator [Acholeplasma hippikon]